MKAELIDHMGSDLTVVNAARVSFDKESDWDTCDNCKENGCCFSPEVCNPLTSRDFKLINYLAKHNHFTPFTHPQIILRETVPIFVARQRFKHVVGFTYNEVSRRYVDDEPEFYVPEFWRKRAENKKQGSSDEVVDRKWSLESLYKDQVELYKAMLLWGVAPEQARMVLPQSMLTSYYVTGSLAAFARAYKLRIDPHAQAEIQDLAKEWDRIIRPLFPVSWEALTS
jgi:thymidylate synthase (FAD)